MSVHKSKGRGKRKKDIKRKRNEKVWEGLKGSIPLPAGKKSD